MTAVPLPAPPFRPILNRMTGVSVRRCPQFPRIVLAASPLALILLALAAGTAAGHPATWAAFALFGKKRRDDDQPDEGQLEAAAASGSEAEAAPGLESVDESMLPRWRRPSLQQVRRSDPLRDAENAPHLSFESAQVRPLENCERRRIGYRLVSLLDLPDELRSREIGILDQGDEVQLLRRHGVYWLVLCPDGRQGWVHRMTLADPAAGVPFDPDPEPMPQYMDDDEVGENAPDLDGNGLLEAYMQARRGRLGALGASLRSFRGGEPSSAASPAAGSAHAGERYSVRKSLGSRRGGGAFRPDTRSRRPSR
jgi:hypothetical protein